MAEKKEPTATTSAVSGAKTQDADNTEGGHGVPKMTKKQLRSHIKQLQKVAATSTDPSLTAQVIALSNKKARKLFLEKINDDDFLSKGIECVDRGTSTETKYVLFKFECKPGALCLVPPSFAAVVNMIDRYCVTIVNPYISPSTE